MKKFRHLPWHWWFMVASVLIMGPLFILNSVLGWEQRWITIVGPLVSIAASLAFIRMLWNTSDPRRASNEDENRQRR